MDRAGATHRARAVARHEQRARARAGAATNAAPRLADLVADMVFTNELNQVVRWLDFEGQAIGLTFLFTRCPVPDYCPRLAKNFAAATRKLRALPDAPTNWHLLALTIDPAFDTPAVPEG